MILLPYQNTWVGDTSQVKVYEKSRRIGALRCGLPGRSPPRPLHFGPIRFIKHVEFRHRGSTVRDAIHSIRDVWQAGYERLLADARAKGLLAGRKGGAERRRDPRFPVASGDVSAAGAGAVELEDMSISGLAFRSARSYLAHRTLTLSLASVFSTETEVLACERLPDGGDSPPRYRVRCRFKDGEHGLQFLTLTLELERVESA